MKWILIGVLILAGYGDGVPGRRVGGGTRLMMTVPVIGDFPETSHNA